jgi:hypothetical protein
MLKWEHVHKLAKRKITVHNGRQKKAEQKKGENKTCCLLNPADRNMNTVIKEIMKLMIEVMILTIWVVAIPAP